MGIRITKSSKILCALMISLCVIISVLLTPIVGISAALSGFLLWGGMAFILSLMDYNDREEAEENHEIKVQHINCVCVTHKI